MFVGRFYMDSSETDGVKLSQNGLRLRLLRLATTGEPECSAQISIAILSA
jgi:hypothetical protein